MGVTIRRGVEWRDDLRNVAPDLWPDLIKQYRFFCRNKLPDDCRELLRMIAEGEHVGWAGFGDRERYVRDGLDLDLDAVDWALVGLRVTGVEAPIGFKEAQTLGKQGRGSDAARDLAGRYLPTPKGNNVTIGQRGNSRAYREAKAARDGKPATYYREKQLTVLRRAWKRATPEDRAIFRAEITE